MNKHHPARRALSRALSLPFSTSTTSTSPPPQAASAFPLKHVTKSNFESALVELRRLVRAADFVAIDLEMTGVTSAPWRESFEFDRSDVHYLKVKDSAEKFAVVQFGVCPFRWDPSNRFFVAHPHNFYVFPRQELQVDGPSYEFLCQTTSIDFLARYQFDFNACIHEGQIFYLKRTRRRSTKTNMAYEDESSDTWCSLKEVRGKPLNRMADILFTERIKNRFSEWRDGLLQDRNGGSQLQWTSDESKQQFQTIFFKMRPAVINKHFKDLTQNQLVVYTESKEDREFIVAEVINKHFKDLTHVCVNGENFCSQQLVVYTESKEDREFIVAEVKAENRRGVEMKIQAAIGFRHVIDLLSSEQKLIVGHNCFLDIAHVYSKFLGPLPLTAEEFASSVNKYFPQIVDTKILLNANCILQQRMKNSRTSLASAFALLCPQIDLRSKITGLALQQCVQVEVQVDELRSSNWNSGAKHEAGYDAFMTGCVFAQACCHLGIDFKLHSPSENLAHNEKLHKHVNLLYLSWTNGDIIDLSTGKVIEDSLGTKNLKRRYTKIFFENIVLIWGFPFKLKAREIRECISKVFGPTSVTSVFHLDETAVFVQFSKAGFVPDFLALKETLERSDGPISVFHPLAKLLEGGNTRAASYEVYKDICSSPVSKILFADQAEAVGIKWKNEVVESEVAYQNRKASEKKILETIFRNHLKSPSKGTRTYCLAIMRS
ncbi:Poly(A)-specific ribonuclease PARN [Morella rubra]|uniref:Poly(A)-specific ribonuclease PARN n=1 Tax=Morella rubra TaxID=262757 RepID=A0A6A1WZX5_9ROSI|nr:Poly(A)-specific ribonuclease PARN [Morella rubra]